MFPENGSNIWAFNITAMSSRDVTHLKYLSWFEDSNIWAFPCSVCNWARGAAALRADMRARDQRWIYDGKYQIATCRCRDTYRPRHVLLASSKCRLQRRAMYSRRETNTGRHTSSGAARRTLRPVGQLSPAGHDTAGCRQLARAERNITSHTLRQCFWYSGTYWKSSVKATVLKILHCTFLRKNP